MANKITLFFGLIFLRAVAAAGDCETVVSLWTSFGKTTTVDPNDPTACCSMEGVTCDGEKVTQINWSSQGLSGTIPSTIGDLVNLVEL
jgi:hypothetical protein